MTSANYEGIIINNEENIFGLTFSPDFDTSQSMHISKILNSIKNKTSKAYKSYFVFKGIQVPILMIGTDANSKNFEYIIEEESNFLNRTFERLQKESLNISYWKDSSNLNLFSEVSILNEDYYIYNKNLFLCRVYSDEAMFFIANPFVSLFKKDELRFNPKSRNDSVKVLKGYKKYVNSYLGEIENRQKNFTKELDTIFEIILNRNNLLIIGTSNMFLSCGYSIIAGNTNDLEVFNKEVFPYKCEDGKLIRLTKDEVKKVISENKILKKKTEKVSIRLNYIEKLLEEKGLSWTVISKNRINFKEDGTYTTWMNAQVYDNANFGWYSEKDFIDWLNMEGKIPFSRGKVNYFSRMLENISKGTFKYLNSEPVDNKKKLGFIENTEFLGVFNSNGKILKFSVEELKKEIEKFEPIKKFTEEDFEKGLKKFTIQYNLKKIF